MSDSLLFDSGHEPAMRAINAALARRGLVVVRSFDLRQALAARAVPEWDCGCPHHGTAQCACQMVVLLVYDQAGEPVVVTAHSRDNRTQVRIVRDANTQPDPLLCERIMTALVEAALARLVQPPVGEHAHAPGA